jgi:CHRD domain
MRRVLLAALLGALVTALATGSYAIAKRGDGGGFRATLNGYHETTGGPPTATGNPTGSISTTGHGRFRASVRGDRIHYVLAYEDMEGGDVTAAHIHFAERHVAGGVIAFLCGGGGKPACTEPDGRFEGDITAADIIGPADQGLEAGNLAEAIRALRNRAVYANVHTARWPEGEIRGDITRRGHGHDDDHDDDDD